MAKPVYRYEKLFYPGGLSDGIPLPIAKKAIYVDKDLSPKKPLIEASKKVVKEMIEKIRGMYKLKNDPIKDWNMTRSTENAPIAEVMFIWGDMPGLTKKGDTTKLIYFFKTGYSFSDYKQNHHFVHNEPTHLLNVTLNVSHIKHHPMLKY